MANAQEPVPDSLVGIYTGNLFSKEIADVDWSLIETNVDEYITFIDTSECEVDICFEAGTINQFPGLKELHTDYSYCHDTFNVTEPGKSYVYFYSIDSLIIFWYGVSGPPLYTHYLEKFCGKRIPNSSYVGVKQLSSLKTRALIYPNPTNKDLYVELVNRQKEKYKLIVRNVYGIITFEGLITNNNYSINVSNFAKGVYFLEWNNGSEKGIEKFVVY